MMTVEKLRDDLDYWIMIGIADDIVRTPAHRPEYQHLVQAFRESNMPESMIPECVLEVLQKECTRPWFMRWTFWRLVYLSVKKFLMGM